MRNAVWEIRRLLIWIATLGGGSGIAYILYNDSNEDGLCEEPDHYDHYDDAGSDDSDDSDDYDDVYCED